MGFGIPLTPPQDGPYGQPGAGIATCPHCGRSLPLWYYYPAKDVPPWPLITPGRPLLWPAPLIPKKKS
ncbi:MAG: hypothetical protein AB1815_12245 [Bacillota bacterium]